MPSKSVKSADRTLEVFELFSRERRPLSTKEIASSLGYPTSSTMYLLKSLNNSGYLNYNKKFRNYFPTSRIKILGSWITGYLPENTEIMDAMKYIRLKFGETVAIGIQSDLNIQYLKAIESDHAIRHSINEGDQRPILDSVMGLMILSNLADHDIEKICRRYNHYIDNRKYDIDIINKKIKKIREDGYYCSEELLGSYYATTVAMNLPTQYNFQDIVIGVGGEKSRVAPKVPVIIAEMRKAIADL